MSEQQKFLWGICNALTILILWAGWIVFSRFGMTQSALSPFDVAILRYGTAFLFLFPFIPKYFPEHKPWWQIIVLSSVAAGLPYSLAGFYAFKTVGVAQSAVLLNGTIGIFSLILMKIWLREKNNLIKIIGIITCLIGVAVIFADKSFYEFFNDFGLAQILLLWSALIMAFYAIIYKKWNFSWQELLVVAAPVQFVIAGILWVIFHETTGIYETPLSMILFQGLFQGLGPSILGVISYAIAVEYLGRVTTSAMMALAPGCAAILAIIILGELPNIYEILGIIIVIIGILMTIEFKNIRKKKYEKIG